MYSLTGVILLMCLKHICNGEYMIPNVTLEAFHPAGFRASIPADADVEHFGFHGKVNQPISQVEPGEFSGDINKPDDGYFTYYKPNLQLNAGDQVNYWVFIQHKQLGYRKDALTWTVKELRLEPGTGCETSETLLSDRTKVCSKIVVFEDNFETLDETKWVHEQYISDAPDYEFVVYKKDADVTFIDSNKLCIKPKLVEDEDELKETINLEDGCTKPEKKTNCARKAYILQNPVISGKITSKVAFTYGEFEIKARLPAGDWIYPEIYLEDQNLRRILIAYSRGNAHLIGNQGDDIGATLLFGGPVAKHSEPDRSKKLSSKRFNEPLNKMTHTYKLRWTPSQIELYIDETLYGQVNTESGFTGENSSPFKLVLGVGAGGVSDFPNEYKSGGNVKPWKNYGYSQVKDFFGNRTTWYPTWGSVSQLQIVSVKVTAI